MLRILRVRGVSCRDIMTPVKERFTPCVYACSWLTSIFREVTAGVEMILEVTITCAPMSSLFVSLLSCFCLASYCSRHAGKAHHRQPKQSRLPPQRQHSIFTEPQWPFRKRLRNGSSRCFQAQAKCWGH